MISVVLDAKLSNVIPYNPFDSRNNHDTSATVCLCFYMKCDQFRRKITRSGWVTASAEEDERSVAVKHTRWLLESKVAPLCVTAGDPALLW